jgi:hypothetical protein
VCIHPSLKRSSSGLNYFLLHLKIGQTLQQISVVLPEGGRSDTSMALIALFSDLQILRRIESALNR